MRTLPIIALAADGAFTSHAIVLGDVRDEDLAPLLTVFYDRLADDPLLAPYFAPLDMATHVPRIADFWSTLLFHSGRYQGNAFRPHLKLDGLRGCHFARWVDAFEETVDAHHAGPVADEMKTIARRIAATMQPRLGVTTCAGRRAAAQ